MNEDRRLSLLNEKEKTVNLTRAGYQKGRTVSSTLENLADPENLEIQHCVNLSTSCTCV